MTREGASKNKTSREDRILVTLSLVPALSWLTAFAVCWVLSTWICATGNRWTIPLVTGLAFAAAALAGIACLRRWRSARRKSADTDPVASRRRFLEAGGVLLALICLLASVALTIPALLHRPCD